MIRRRRRRETLKQRVSPWELLRVRRSEQKRASVAAVTRRSLMGGGAESPFRRAVQIKSRTAKMNKQIKKNRWRSQVRKIKLGLGLVFPIWPLLYGKLLRAQHHLVTSSPSFAIDAGSLITGSSIQFPFSPFISITERQSDARDPK